MTEEKNKSNIRIEYVKLSSLKKAPRNPKMHAVVDIADSVERFGFVEPIIINEDTGKMVSGHGRIESLILLKEGGVDPPANIIITGNDWEVPVIRGNHFKDELEAEAYLLTCNRLVETGGWDEELLEAMVQVVQPIGFEELTEQINNSIDQALEDAPEISIYPSGLEPTHIADPNKGVGDMKVTKEGLQEGETYATDERRSTPDFDDIPGHLQGVFELASEDRVFTSEHVLGIPDLLPDMILPEIPQPLLTWGGRRETPDDGTSNYLFVHGTAAGEQCPYERALTAWWTHDVHIKALLESIAYKTGQLINSKVIGTVVPDVSLYRGNPMVLHMLAVYQSAWAGRYFQESGVKVVPRFEYFIPECREFSLAGIPKSSPTLATQLHTGFEDSSIPDIKKAFMEGLDIIRPGQLLVYVSNRGANLIEDMRKELPVQEIIMVPTVKQVRRKSDAEPDPYLRKLRQSKGQWRSKGDDETSEMAEESGEA